MPDIYPILLISSGCGPLTVATFVPTEEALAFALQDHFASCSGAPNLTAWAMEITSRLCEEDLYESDVGKDAHITAVARCENRLPPRYARSPATQGTTTLRDAMAAMDDMCRRKGWKEE